VLRMTWKVYACPKRMLSSRINGEGELRRQPANPGSPGKIAIKRVRACIQNGDKNSTISAYLLANLRV